MKGCIESLRDFISKHSELELGLGTTFNEVPSEHFHSPRPFPPPS
jgi:hypothetical protein